MPRGLQYHQRQQRAELQIRRRRRPPVQCPPATADKGRSLAVRRRAPGPGGSAAPRLLLATTPPPLEVDPLPRGGRPAGVVNTHWSKSEAEVGASARRAAHWSKS